METEIVYRGWALGNGVISALKGVSVRGKWATLMQLSISNKLSNAALMSLQIEDRVPYSPWRSVCNVLQTGHLSARCVWVMNKTQDEVSVLTKISIEKLITGLISSQPHCLTCCCDLCGKRLICFRVKRWITPRRDTDSKLKSTFHAFTSKWIKCSFWHKPHYIENNCHFCSLRFLFARLTRCCLLAGPFNPVLEETRGAPV